MFTLIFASIVFSTPNDNPAYPYSMFEGPPEMELYCNYLNYLADFLPPNPVILEAGAHYGIDTLRFIEKWPKSTIYSFEPNPNAYEKFIESTKDFPQVHGVPFALNTYEGTALFHICHGTEGNDLSVEGASSLLEASEKMKTHYIGPDIGVSCVVLDDWCKSSNISEIDLLWLDLEGMELQVLQSAPEILKTVKVIFTETNFMRFRKNGTFYFELKKFLKKQGFQELAHWYLPAIQGNAIFINSSLQ